MLTARLASRAVAASAALLFASAVDVRGQRAPEPSDDPRWSFFFNVGGGGVDGDFATALEKPLTGDFGLRRTRGGWRYGLGLSFGSFAMKTPFEGELE